MNGSSIQIPSAAGPQFTMFPKLPLEVRVLIWRHAMENIGSRLVNSTLKEPSNTVPGVLQACKLSRKEGLKKYHRCGVCLGWSGETYAYFISYDTDMLVLDVPSGVEPYMLEMIDDMKCGDVPITLTHMNQWKFLKVEKLQRLVVGWDYWRWLCKSAAREGKFRDVVAEDHGSSEINSDDVFGSGTVVEIKIATGKEAIRVL
ncbi:uncharacterized protein BP5553_04037 [Venustampulla echinocandica]|uniref:2EXR domain-containing protein n=1 Tax=Venustampulla echinocandica TaxID=2656787 RepID=A0A370TVY8_9HELO|nr:uncharacterized protein BP5553_04037 [Venustampulla echinocandica]RDL39697.1 hypothetical protein BP5553_04037 [Venustampulla echinocandica]